MRSHEYLDRVLNESQDTQLNKFVHSAYVNVNKDWIDPKRLAPEKHKTWRQIQEEYKDKPHCLRLECVKCDNTETCRCSKPKTLERGICYYCTGEMERPEPLKFD
jgi:hypothetical protein